MTLQAAQTPAAEMHGDAGSAPQFSFAVSRALTTVVVTLHGEPDEDSAETLSAVLGDLIEYQRGQDVVVDLRDLAAVDHSVVDMFRDAFSLASLHGATFRLHGPPPALCEALTQAR